MIGEIANRCRQLGFKEAYAFAKSLEPSPNPIHPALAAVGKSDAALLFRHHRTCSKIAARLRSRHSIAGSEEEHTMLLEWALLMGQNFRPISDPLIVNPRQYPRRRDNNGMGFVELQKSIAQWIELAREEDQFTTAAISLNLVCRHDLRARLRKIGFENEVFDALEATLVGSQPLSAERVIRWCNAIQSMLLNATAHGRHVGLIIVADTTARAFLRFTRRKGGPDSGVQEVGFRPGSYMGWSFDIACFAFPTLSDREGAATWKSINRHVEANPSDADRWLEDNGLKGIRDICLPWLNQDRG